MVKLNNMKSKILKFSTYTIILCFMCDCGFNFEKEWLQTKYDVTETGLDQLINLHGIFVPDNPLHNSLLFFNDGSVGYVFVDIPDTAKTNFDLKSRVNYCSGLGYHKVDSLWANGYSYCIKNDTIIVNECTRLEGVWNYYQRKYLVVNKDTLCRIEGSYFCKKPENIRTWKESTLYHFVPTATLLDKDGMITKRKKWLWRNEEDWKEYMQRMKQKRKENKQQKKLNK